MNANSAKTIAWKYNLCINSAPILGVVLLTLAYHYLEMELVSYVILACALYAVLPSINGHFYKKYIAALLEWKMDAPMFLQALDCLRVADFAPQRCLGNYYAGNYREAAQVCSNLLTEKAFRKYWGFCYSMRMRIWLETDDREKLAAEYEAYTAYIAQIKNPQRRETLLEDTLWYKCWLDGDIQTCIREMEKAKDANTNLNRFTRDYLLAILHHRSGNNQQAQLLFTQIINRAPNLYFVQVAKDSLQAMERGEIHTLPQIQAQPDATAVAGYKKKQRKISLPRLIQIVLLTVLLALTLFFYLRPVPIEKHIAQLVTEEFGSDAAYQCVTIADDNGKDFVLCIISSRGELHSIWLYAEGKDYFWMEASYAPLLVGETYHLADPWDYSCLELMICDDREAVPENALQVKTMDSNGKTLYICILSQAVCTH